MTLVSKKGIHYDVYFQCPGCGNRVPEHQVTTATQGSLADVQMIPQIVCLNHGSSIRHMRRVVKRRPGQPDFQEPSIPPDPFAETGQDDRK